MLGRVDIGTLAQCWINRICQCWSNVPANVGPKLAPMLACLWGSVVMVLLFAYLATLEKSGDLLHNFSCTVARRPLYCLRPWLATRLFWRLRSSNLRLSRGLIGDLDSLRRLLSLLRQRLRLLLRLLLRERWFWRERPALLSCRATA